MSMLMLASRITQKYFKLPVHKVSHCATKKSVYCETLCELVIILWQVGCRCDYVIGGTPHLVWFPIVYIIRIPRPPMVCHFLKRLLLSPLPVWMGHTMGVVRKTTHGFRHFWHRHLVWDSGCSRWNLWHSRDVGWAIQCRRAHQRKHRILMSFVSNFTYSKMDTNLEMLTAREQLMEDIDSIIDGWWVDTFEDEHSEEKEHLTRILCDAVCKNFPTNWCNSKSFPLSLMLMTVATILHLNHQQVRNLQRITSVKFGRQMMKMIWLKKSQTMQHIASFLYWWKKWKNTTHTFWRKVTLTESAAATSCLSVTQNRHRVRFRLLYKGQRNGPNALHRSLHLCDAKWHATT